VVVVAPPGGWYPACKAVGDALGAAVLLVLCLPVMALAMLAVKLTSRGPALYSQRRMGRYGREFTIYKVRSMYHRCEDRSGVRWSDPNHDPRVTPVGWYLRKLHIDELPQLWNVLKGDMSLVGPRPERPEIVRQLEQVIPHYRQRLMVRPGMTGLAQVQLPPDTDLASVRRKLAYDLFYIRTLWFRTDVKIYLGTVVYLAGIPVSFMRRVLRVPGGHYVELAYERLVEQAAPQVRPA
jgi:lipopolysaccharide/colanic/teichoic acid biosynthesis glycosyltransferase